MTIIDFPSLEHATVESVRAEVVGRLGELESADTRAVYRELLPELARVDERIVSLDADLGGHNNAFAHALPDRHFNFGIAEANMMTAAAGMASLGHVPFVNTMASFAVTRACEQLKLDVAFHNANVKIVGTYGGVAGGPFGHTHHSLEDIAILRAIPNLTIINPADAIETVNAVVASLEIDGPVYIRIGRDASPRTQTADAEFEVGRAQWLREGDDVAIVASGSGVMHIALEAAELLHGRGISAGVLNMHTIKPLDEAAFVEAAARVAGFVTVEEHNILGGLGGAVAETLSRHAPSPVTRIGFDDIFCEYVGSQAEILNEYRITARAVADAAVEIVKSAEQKRRRV